MPPSARRPCRIVFLSCPRGAQIIWTLFPFPNDRPLSSLELSFSLANRASYSNEGSLPGPRPTDPPPQNQHIPNHHHCMPCETRFWNGANIVYAPADRLHKEEGIEFPSRTAFHPLSSRCLHSHSRVLHESEGQYNLDRAGVAPFHGRKSHEDEEVEASLELELIGTQVLLETQ